MIVLDTDHLSCLEWGSEESANLRARLAEASDRKIVVSIASYEEQMRGWLEKKGEGTPQGSRSFARVPWPVPRRLSQGDCILMARMHPRSPRSLTSW